MLALNSPSSPNVFVIALKISGVVSVSCSDQEKESLNDANSAVEQALVFLNAALTAVQEQIEGLIFYAFIIYLVSFFIFQY